MPSSLLIEAEREAACTAQVVLKHVVINGGTDSGPRSASSSAADQSGDHRTGQATEN